MKDKKQAATYKMPQNRMRVAEKDLLHIIYNI
jgi:hypothetical protein